MKFNIIHIIICIFVFVGCTQQTVNNSVECFTIPNLVQVLYIVVTH